MELTKTTFLGWGFKSFGFRILSTIGAEMKYRNIWVIELRFIHLRNNVRWHIEVIYSTFSRYLWWHVWLLHTSVFLILSHLLGKSWRETDHTSDRLAWTGHTRSRFQFVKKAVLLVCSYNFSCLLTCSVDSWPNDSFLPKRSIWKYRWADYLQTRLKPSPGLNCKSELFHLK